jgi:hypothetical protein
MRGAVGIALAPDRIATVSWSRALAPLVPDAVEWDDLQLALVELKQKLGLRRPRAFVALLPPLAQARVVELPRLTAAEYTSVLSRDAARYFVTGRIPQLAAGQPLESRGSPVRVLAAAAPRDGIDAVVGALDRAGWRVETIVPAEAAWLAAAGAGGGRGRRDGVAIVVAAGDAIEVLHVEAGRLASLRRVPVSSCSPEDVTAALTELGVTVQRLTDPTASAAVGAWDAVGPQLLPERSLVERRNRATRQAVRLSAAALALLVAAAGLDWWGARRDLAAVAARRAVIRGEVAAALARQDTVDDLLARHAGLVRADREAMRWSEVLADFSDYLPRDAHLAAFRGRGDSVGLEGVAQRAAGVFAALQRAPRVAGVRADAPIRQEGGRRGAPPVERFAVTARLSERPP